MTEHPLRGDIQGLRAVAVLLVVLSHAGVPGLRGGYIGVDVFFVVSGFVITRSLFGRQHAKGISLPTFYAARARRILPMSTVVLLATVLASWALLNFVRAGEVVTDAIWATFFGANFRFASIETDYFAAGTPQSPLQHYWSLAVEEQFYLVWPLLMGLLLFGLNRHRRRGAPLVSHNGRLAAGLGVIIVVSLLWSIRQTAEAPGAAFFSPLTRTWELAAGALLAVGIVTTARVPGSLRAAMSWAGLAGVLASAMLFDDATPIPGWLALLPVLSTAAIIAGGTGRSPGGAERLLQVPPLRAVGDCSYSFYLWHWPILIIAAAYAERDLSLATKLALTVGALVLSFASYRLIETPFRRMRWLREEHRTSLVLWPVTILVLLMACVWTTTSLRAQAGEGPTAADPVSLEEVDAAAAADPTPAVKLAVAAAKAGDRVPAVLSPSLGKLAVDAPLIDDKCTARHADTTHDICKYGDPTATRSIVVIGDSHALMWVSAVDAIGKKYGWVVYPFAKLGCSFAAVNHPPTDTVPAGACDKWRAWALDGVRKLNPDRIIVANLLQNSLVDANGRTFTNVAALAQLWQAGLTATARSLKATGARVTLLSDVPGLKKAPAECLLSRKVTMATCTSGFEPVMKRLNEAAHSASLAAQVGWKGLDPWFCASDRCPTVIGSVIAYRDINHISRTYALRLAEPLGRGLGLIPPKAATAAQGTPGKATDATSTAVVQAVSDGLAGKPIPGNLQPSLAKLSHDFDGLGDCASGPGDTTSKICKLGDTNAKRSIVVIGDSHAGMWVPTFAAIGKKYGWVIYPLIKNSCMAAEVAKFNSGGGLNNECARWRTWALKTAVGLKPDRVVFANLLHIYLADDDGSAVAGATSAGSRWQDGTASSVKTLAAGGARVTVLSDPPGLKNNPTDCLLEPGADMGTCASPPEQTKSRLNLSVQAGATDGGGDYADLDSWFCAANRCPSVIGTIVPYWDNNHVSLTYAKHLTVPMAQKLGLT